MSKVTDRHGRPTSGQMPGLVEAIVTDNKDPDKLGRVKVKFPTLPNAPESTWARMAAPMAGKNRGWVTLPEADDEVLVSFMHGDFSSAVVLGGLFNGKDTPPYANEDGDNNLRVFQSRSGHRVTFDDTSGSERIELVVSNEEIKVIWDAANKVLSVYSGKDIVLEAKESFEVKCKDFTLEASNNVSVSATAQLKLEAKAGATLDGGAQLAIKSSMTKINS